MVVVAAIDCGSNSTRLLISEVNNGKLKKLFKTHKVTKTSQGLQDSGRISNDNIFRHIKNSRNNLNIVQSKSFSELIFASSSSNTNSFVEFNRSTYK